MSSINQVTISGTIASAPEPIGQSGAVKVRFQLRESYKGQETTRTLEVKAFGDQASQLSQMPIGTPLLIGGKLDVYNGTSQSGNEYTVTSVAAFQITRLGAPRPEPQQAPPPPLPQPRPRPPQPQYEDSHATEDDLLF